MKTKTTPLFLITVICLSGFSTAKLHAWQKEYVYDYQMSENDSRNSAKNAAVEQIKLKAAQEAGTYMQGTTVLQGEDLTETIIQIGSAIVKVNVLKDELKLNTEGNQFLSVTALADVDESVMEKKISALREDKSKADAIKKLAVEYNELHKQLNALRQEKVGFF